MLCSQPHLTMPSLDSESLARSATQVLNPTSSHLYASNYTSSSHNGVGASSAPSGSQMSQSSNTSKTTNKMISSQSSSPSASTATSPMPLPTRPRHHSRSVSQDAARFTSTIESFHLSPPRRPSHGPSSTHMTFKATPSTSSSAPTSKSATPISSPPSTSPKIPSSPHASSASSNSVDTAASRPASASKSQGRAQLRSETRTSHPQLPPSQLPLALHNKQISHSSTDNSSSTASPTTRDDESVSSDTSTATPTSSTVPSSTEGSPVRKRPSNVVPTPSSSNQSTSSPASSSLPSDDETRLQHLLQVQASRRPKLLRLTPAFASLPGKFPLPTASTASTSSQEAPPSTLAFPKMERSASTSPVPSGDLRKNFKDSGKIAPPDGLLALDMSNLPTPSARDSSAPQSTSDLPEVRTKSGRLIKPSLKHASTNWSPASYTGRADSGPPAVSGSLRAKSTPNTPSVPKVVQFDTHLERVKVFKFKQRPTAISRSGSPEQTETETEEERELFPFVNYGRRSTSPPTSGFVTPSVAGGKVMSSALAGATEAEEQLVLRLPNFPSSARLTVDKEVYLERIYLADDLRSVKGTVRVKNISFEKWVAVRFTLDNWVTVNEVSAEYSDSLPDGQTDRFSFSIKLNELLNWPRGAGQHESKTMFLCLRYTTSNGEFWDNNDDLNYQLDFRKRQLPSTPTPTPAVARPSSRSQTISGPAASAQQARIIELARRNGVQAGKGGSFVDDLRRELDKLRSDGEEDDRPPIVTKKMVAEVALGKQLGGGQRNSPPLSPGGRRGGTSPMWSARYDWSDSFRNSSSNGSRSRPSAYDYFNAKPPASAAASMMKGGDTDAPSLQLNEGAMATPQSNNSSAEATPQLRAFGQTRSGMFSPAVGDVYAHHQPISNPSVESSAASSPTKPIGSVGSLSVPTARSHFSSSRDGRSSPGNGASPTGRGLHRSHDSSNGKYFSFPPQRKGASSPYASEVNSLEGSDEEEDQVNPRYARSPAVRISTVPKSSLKTSYVSAPTKDDSMVLQNYDMDQNTASPLQRSPPSPSMFSPSASISSVESDITVSEEGSKMGGLCGDESPTTATPRVPARRRWSPPSSTASNASLNELQPSSSGAVFGLSAAADGAQSPEHERARAKPRSAAELSELIQKYCWSNEMTPGTAPLPPGAGSKAKGTVAAGLTPSDGDLFNSYRLSSPPISGSATPTLDL